MVRITEIALLSCLALMSCKQVECAEGTVEANGHCVAIGWRADGGPETYCGPHTVWDGNHCIPSQDLCGPFTKPVVVVDDAGVESFVCQGTPSNGEEPPPDCPAPDQGKMCINGWARYLVGPDDPTKILQTVVADDKASPDATNLVVLAFDPLLFATDPTNPAALLGQGEVDPKKGTFRIEGVAVPSSGFVALVTEDCAVTDGTCETVPASQDPATYAFTALPYPASANQNLEGVSAAVVRVDQETRWSSTIGSSALEGAGCSAADLSECGTWIGFYVQPTDEGFVPIDGVTPFSGGNPIAPEKTFYFGISNGSVVFDDPNQGVVWSDADGPHEWTGIYGLVFAPGMALGTYYGQCAQEDTESKCSQGHCHWDESRLGGTSPGVLFVELMDPAGCPGL